MTTAQVQGYRLSPQQAHVWLLQHQAPAAFHAQAVIGLAGDLDARLLHRALERIVERHDILRTTYHHTPGIPLPIQSVAERGGVEWREVDLRHVEPEPELREIRRQEVERRFDLDRGPVLRGVLARLGERSHCLILTLPSVGADRGTVEGLLAEVAAEYGALRNGAPGEAGEEIVQYLQFSEWQHEILADAEGAGFWRRQNLADWRARLPWERATAPAVPFAPHAHTVALSADDLRRVEELATALDASAAAVLLAAWQALLVRLTGQRRQIVGVTIDGRRYDELKGSFGLFSRTVPVGPPLPPDLAFGDAVGRVHEALADAAEWQGSFAAAEDAEGGGPGCPVGFEYARVPLPRAEGGVVFALREARICIERCALALCCLAGEEGLRLEVACDASRVDPLQAERIAGRLCALLADALARPAAPLGDLAALGGEERRWLLEELNRTRADYPRDRCVHELFAAVAAARPDAVAAACDGVRLTYGELDGKADQLAWSLQALGVGTETPVAILLERSLATLVAILGTLKAGGAYVPLDPAHPRERLACMLDDARPRVVLTLESLAGLLPPTAAHVVCLDREEAETGRQRRGGPPALAAPESLAYVIYTSGSTGRPKGVMVSHRGLVNYLSWAVRAYGVETGEAAPVHSPISFDLTVTSLFAPLLAGRTVELLAERDGVQALGRALGGPGDFSLVKITPAHLDLLRYDLEGSGGGAKVRALVLGGEALLGESLSFWRLRSAETRLINEYGPTETVVGCCVHELLPGAELAGPVPIGRPIANTRLYVLDPGGRPVPAGVPGELSIGGDGVARGYLGCPDLTAERFVPDPFGGAGDRLYRSGDLARHLPDGDLEFLGRTDRQVKIRGFRIELGEVEAALARHPAVREVAVVDRVDEAGGGRRLAAYVVPAEGGERAPGADELRRWLAARLPELMIPAAFVILDRLPLTANGKVDRAALPAPGAGRTGLEREYVAPATAGEQALAEVWMDALGIGRVGVHDNFFALGGDSMRSVRVVNLARDRGLLFTVQDLFRHPTIAGLIAALGAESGAEGGEQDLAALLDELEALPDEEIHARLARLEAPAE